MSRTWMVCDGHGTLSSDGHADADAARRAAQASANHTGETRYVYGPDDTDETAEPVEPDVDAEKLARQLYREWEPGDSGNEISTDPADAPGAWFHPQLGWQK
jgi:hypothetical protein